MNERRFEDPRLKKVAYYLLLAFVALACYGLDAYFIHKEWTDKSTKTFLQVDTRINDALVGKSNTPKYSPILFGGMDSYFRLFFAREMIESGQWRLRHTKIGGPKEGREVSWTSPMSWALISLASVGKLFMTQSPFPQDEHFLFWASFWIHPIFFLIGTIALIFILTPVMGRWCMLPIMCMWGAIYGFTEPLNTASCDHHGLQMIGSILMLAGILRATCAKNYSWWIFSGICGAFALWIQSITMLPLLAAVILGAAIAGLLKKAPPRPWAYFSFSMAASSLLFYLIEFFPHWHLHAATLHPSYVLLFIGTAFGFLWLEKCEDRKFFWAALFTLTIFSLWWLSLYSADLRNPMMNRLEEGVRERITPWESWKPSFFLFYWQNIGILHLALGILIFFGIRSWEKFIQALPFLLACVFTAVLTALYVRFIYFHAIALLITIAWFTLKKNLSFKGVRAFCVIISLCALSSLGLRTMINSVFWGPKTFYPNLLPSIVDRQAALEMKPLIENRPDRPTRILGGNVLHIISLYGGAPVTSTLYWENIKGVEITAHAFAGMNDHDALRIVRENQISHILVKSTPSEPFQWLYIRWGKIPLPILNAIAPSTLVFRLLVEKHVPPWLEKIPPEKIPFSSMLGYKLYKVLP